MNKLKEILLGIIGGILYILIEIAWRGYSHWSMFIVGGLCFVIIGSINEFLKWETPLWKQALIGASSVIVLEFISGCIVNLWLGWNVWDYSDIKFNLLGQVCPQFFVLWILLSIVGIILDDYLRYLIFKEEKPRYKLF